MEPLDPKTYRFAADKLRWREDLEMIKVEFHINRQFYKRIKAFAKQHGLAMSDAIGVFLHTDQVLDMLPEVPAEEPKEPPTVVPRVHRYSLVDLTKNTKWKRKKKP